MATCSSCNGSKICQNCHGNTNKKCACGVWDSIAGVNTGSRQGKCITCSGKGTT